MILTGLILNLALLVALSVVSGFVDGRWRRETRLGALLQGVVFGGAAVIGMLNPVVIVPGLIFDGRSVVISLAGLFFGPWAAGTAGLMAIPVRVFQGGPGMKMGVLVILSSVILGIVFHARRKHEPREISSGRLLLFGLVVHVAMLLMTLALPRDMTLPVLKRIGWPVMLAYPLATVLIGKILSDQAARGEFLSSLQASENRYRGLFENSRDAIMTVEPPTWKFTSANPATVAVFRAQSQQQLLALTPWDLSPERQPNGHLSAELARETIERALREGSLSFEWTHRRLDGETFPATVLMSRIEVAGKAFLQATLRDITERKRAEDDLLRSHEQYRRAILAAGAVPYQKRYNEPGYAFMPDSIQELTGYRPNELCSAVWNEIILESVMMGDAAGLTREEAIERGRRGQIKHWRVDHRIRKRDGEIRWLSDSSVQTYDASGGVTGSIGIIQDITERKQLEAQLRQAQKMEAIGQLAGGVAHDFNNILAAMMMQLGLLQQSATLDPETREALKDLELGAERAAGLTRQLLVFSRRSVLEMKVWDLNKVIDNLLKMLRRLIGENIDLKFESAAELPLVEADLGMMEQLLMNLAVNARDAMPKGGQLSIVTGVAAFGENDERPNPAARPGEYVCLKVADTGCGMNEATQKRIFEPFFTTKEVGKGTGLGLATVHGIVAQHEGWIEVDSKVGLGSTFRVYLPALKRPQKEGADSKVPSQSALEGLRGQETILVVEDEAGVRRQVGHLLTSLGYRVLEASGGPEALAQWARERDRISLVLTDMVMPGGVTGMELADRFRREKPALKVIISSGYSADMPAQPIGTAPPGITFLPKPYAAASLGQTLRSCLDAGWRPNTDGASFSSAGPGSKPT